MKAELTDFGLLLVDGQRFDHDVVISSGRVTKRDKKPSKRFGDRFGHTPLSDREEVPWSGDRLVIGTGFSGRLPVMDEVLQEAERRGIEVVAMPTREACRLLEDSPSVEVNAILHVTC